MELRQLKYFIKIVELGSISRAAGAVFVAQSALSQQIASLESELGCKLLSRNARGVTPTLAGATFHRHAVAVIKGMENLQSAVRVAAKEPSGRVTIGLPVSMSRILTVPLLLAAAETLPNVVLTIDESPSNYLPELLLSGRLDLALVYSEDIVRSIKTTYLLEEDLFLIESASMDGKPNQNETVPLDFLDGMPIALTSEPNSIRRLVDAACNSANVSYKLVAEVSSPVTLIDIARSRLAATIMSWSALGPARDDPSLSIRLLDSPRLSRTIAMGENADMPGNEATLAVKLILMNVLDRLLEERGWFGARKAKGHPSPDI
ncbi:LysR substrate-binding domain-containing protein [Pollutimonas bauzanensis]|uniref:LysR family transcriptional regulator, nitrogen assimilation regulatory protein n=1 Tax=Pollutimonas bauzanensis TaxID=658167 RepID=A0A1M6AYA8_9BURK|nr:LysR substrate-binding domain-containing protein [Pollutimonas bauzanensis]SHI41484.1 LysR family transcriptional regulator, nitrogen assimilation regulatory protein [Pollutimonas bauzanensis]